MFFFYTKNSFGIVLYELTTCKEPYDGEFNSFKGFFSKDLSFFFSHHEILFNKTELIDAVAMHNVRPKISKDQICPSLITILEKTWHPQPTYRPSFEDLLQQNWFDKIIRENLISEFNIAGRNFWTKYYPNQVKKYNLMKFKSNSFQIQFIFV